MSKSCAIVQKKYTTLDTTLITLLLALKKVTNNYTLLFCSLISEVIANSNIKDQLSK